MKQFHVSKSNIFRIPTDLLSEYKWLQFPEKFNFVITINNIQKEKLLRLLASTWLPDAFPIASSMINKHPLYTGTQWEKHVLKKPVKLKETIRFCAAKFFFFFVMDTFSDENNEIFSSVTLCKDIKNISCAILKIIFSPQTMPGTHASIW